MLELEDIKIELTCQGYEVKQLSFSPMGDRSIVVIESTKKTSEATPLKTGDRLLTVKGETVK